MTTSNTYYSAFDTALMSSLLDSASERLGFTYPNPVTAAAVVQDGEVIGWGVHAYAGGPHAEVLAIQDAGDRSQGATLYVTLEPCTHHGRTGACVEAIIQAGITKVVYAVRDPNTRVSENPARPLLEAQGISVVEGVCEVEARSINSFFFKNMKQALPYVHLKVGMSLDSKIALSHGESQYITSEASRRHVHQLRAQVQGIIVGIETVIQDDPQLTVRFDLSCHQQPTVIILDSQGRLSPEASLLQGVKGGSERQVLLLCDQARVSEISERSWPDCVTVVGVPRSESGLAWEGVLSVLYQRGFCNVMIEGGAGVFTSAIDQDIVDCLHLYTAPVVLGDRALSFYRGSEKERLSSVQRLGFRLVSSLTLDTDSYQRLEKLVTV